MQSPQQIEDFLRANHLILTAADLADELGISVVMISYYCDKLGIKPVKVKQRNINFVLANHETMSAIKIGKMLGLDGDRVLKYYGKMLGVSFKPEEEKQKKTVIKAELPPPKKEPEASAKKGPKVSPRTILGNYQFPGGYHYNVIPPDISEAIKNLLKIESKTKL